jgi:acyl carrier protein
MTAVEQRELTDQTMEIIQRITNLPMDRLERDKKLKADLDVDSLTLIELAVTIQDELEVAVPDEQLQVLETVGDIVDIVNANAAASA